MKTEKVVIARDLEKEIEVTIEIPKDKINPEVQKLIDDQKNSIVERVKVSQKIQKKWENK